MNASLLIALAGIAALAAKVSGSPSAVAVDVTPPPQPTPANGDSEKVDASLPSTWATYDRAFQNAAVFYDYPWTWLKAIALNETLLGTDAFYLAHDQGSSDGLSWGLMQMTLPTAGDAYGSAVTADQLRDDNFSIRLASIFLGRLYAQFHGDERKIIMSYNQGAGNTLKGAEYAAPYYDRWARWKTKIESGALS